MTAALHSGLQAQRWDGPASLIFVHAWSLFLGARPSLPDTSPQGGGGAERVPLSPGRVLQEQSRSVVTSPCSGIAEMWVQNLL